MIGWIWRVFVGRFRVCDHVWKTERSVKVTTDGKYTNDDKYLNCTKCGDWKKVRL